MSVWFSHREQWRRSFTAPVALLSGMLLTAVGAEDALGQRTRAELSAAPTVTPMTARPEILNAVEVVRAMQEAYPPMLRDAGIGGTVMVYLFIDENGRVANTVLSSSSGHTQLDQAALDVARVYRFKPAMNRDQAVPVWVVFPLTFRQPERAARGVQAIPEASRSYTTPAPPLSR